MPIRPENRKRYPYNWKEIRDEILKRAQNKCEWCKLQNHIFGFREIDNSFYEISVQDASKYRELGYKPLRIVLTIAHLDHTPENCSPDNLAALCQQCHNRYDAPQRAINRKLNKEKVS